MRVLLLLSLGVFGDWIDTFLGLPTTEKPREYLKALTARAHVAGSAGDNETVDYVWQQLNNSGMMPTTEYFSASINFPIQRFVRLVEPVPFECAMVEPALAGDPTSNLTESVLTYLGYGASGNVSAELVYVNYGRVEDFAYLDTIGVNVSGKIVIARYGQNFRGVKVRLAQLRGAVGVLIYSDPQDDGFTHGPVYPDGPWRPADGVQRGSAHFSMICPGEPSMDRMELCFNSTEDQHDKLGPTMPVLPLSWADAQPLLANLGGFASPPSWQGGLNNSYIGPGPSVVWMGADMSKEQRVLTNIFATIPGNRSDQQIIVGNHRDAWVYGASDPSSGTAVLLELARCLNQLTQQGWKPLRTIKFASWDGEEFALLGSTHYGENNGAELQNTVAAYLNIDVAVAGPVLAAKASPALIPAIVASISRLIDPDTGKNLSEVWSGSVPPPGAGSDFTVFTQHLGIPSLDIEFDGRDGIYHSIYDSFTWMDTQGDPGFKYHQVMTQLIGSILLTMADEPIIPLNYNRTAQALLGYVATIDASLQSKNATQLVDLTPLRTAATAYLKVADQLEGAVRAAQAAVSSTANANVIDELNSLILQAERKFLNPAGLPGRFWFKHVLQAPGINNGYGSDVFPGLTEAVSENDWDKATSQVTVLSTTITNAADFISANLPTDTLAPSTAPTSAPTTTTASPTQIPTLAPTTTSPTSAPTSTHSPTASPSSSPTAAPTSTHSPTSSTAAPTGTSSPTASPTTSPTSAPTTSSSPTTSPTTSPTSAPTTSRSPTSPTTSPTSAPTTSRSPTSSPTSTPTAASAPTSAPTSTNTPTTSTLAPTSTFSPTQVPTQAPTSPSDSPLDGWVIALIVIMSLLCCGACLIIIRRVRLNGSLRRGRRYDDILIEDRKRNYSSLEY